MCTARVSGYGRTGPLADKPGYDLIIQGYSGLMSTTGEPDGPPLRTGYSLVDLFTGMMAYGSIVTALYNREHTGKGQYVEASLLEGQVAVMSYHAVGYLATGRVPGRLGSGHPSLVPYQAFPSSDGFFIIGCGNDGLWRRLCPAIGREDLMDHPKFQTNTLRVGEPGRNRLHTQRANEVQDHRRVGGHHHGGPECRWDPSTGCPMWWWTRRCWPGR